MIDCSEGMKIDTSKKDTLDLVDRVHKSFEGSLTRDQALTLRAELFELYGLGGDTDIPCPDCKKPLVVTYTSLVSCLLENQGCGKTGPDYTFL